MIVDLFCGAGGWAAGLHALGVDPHTTLGVDFDEHACSTHRTAGFPTLQADISSLDPHAVAADVQGLIASPPCQAFSRAGKGKGRDAIAVLLAHIDSCADGWIAPEGVLVADDVRADLTLQPLRWAWELRPRWIVCEQVPDTLPAWDHMARVLDGWGYSTWSGKLNAERYGVPQTRERAFLIARTDGQPAGPPAPTHTGYNARLSDGGRTPEPSLLGDDLLPWVSMADALGWGMPDRPFYTYAGVSAHAVGDREFGGSSVREVLADRAASGDPERWVVQTGANSMKHSRNPDDLVKYERTVDAPAPTVDAKVGGAWKIAPWTHERPATTVVGSFCPDVIAAPGYRGAGDGPRQDAPGSVRVTVEQAAALQSFPHWWPWQGPKTARYRQIGNAVPPLLAAAVVGTVLDRATAQEMAA